MKKKGGYSGASSLFWVIQLHVNVPMVLFLTQFFELVIKIARVKDVVMNYSQVQLTC